MLQLSPGEMVDMVSSRPRPGLASLRFVVIMFVITRQPAFDLMPKSISWRRGDRMYEPDSTNEQVRRGSKRVWAKIHSIHRTRQGVGPTRGGQEFTGSLPSLSVVWVTDEINQFTLHIHCSSLWLVG